MVANYLLTGMILQVVIQSPCQMMIGVYNHLQTKGI